MYWRTIVAALLAVGLLFTHWEVYLVGRHGVEEKYQAAALKAETEARTRETTLTAAKQKAEEQYVQEKQKHAATAAGARTELGKLRNALASRGAASESPAACTGTDGCPRLERELFGQCASALTSMAAEADRLEGIIVGLQEYVKGVCQAQ